MMSPTQSLGQMGSQMSEALGFQSELNAMSKDFNSAMAAKDAEKKAWEKVKG